MALQLVHFQRAHTQDHPHLQILLDGQKREGSRIRVRSLASMLNQRMRIMMMYFLLKPMDQVGLFPAFLASVGSKSRVVSGNPITVQALQLTTRLSNKSWVIINLRSTENKSADYVVIVGRRRFRRRRSICRGMH
jgi:hypothetical protein